MSDFDNDQTQEETPLVKQLRKQLNDAQKTLKEQGEALTGFLAKERTATLAEKLAAKSLNPKVANLIPKDLELDKLDDWISDYADVFGVPAPAEEQADPEAQARQRLSAVEAAATPSSNDVASAIAGATSAEELIAIIQNAR